MSNIGSYPKIYNLGHKCIEELLLDEVLVEEKVDGSAFSMRVTDGQLYCRSKGAFLDLEHPQQMFIKAIEVAKDLQPKLAEGWTYRCEYLSKPKHNALAYDRVPKNHIVIYDIDTAIECYLPYDRKVAEATRLGLEVVPFIYQGMVTDINQLKEYLTRTSFLGGQLIEGVVIKNYKRFAADGKVLLGKHVSEAFKEVLAHEWKDMNVSQGDILKRIAEKFKTPARWEKALQHLREKGELTDSPKDIGGTMREIVDDITVECKDEIMELLWNWARKDILRHCTLGFPEYYKDKLMAKQFEAKDDAP